MDNGGATIEFPPASATIISSGHSTVYRVSSVALACVGIQTSASDGGVAGWLAVKVVSNHACRPPHNIQKEVEIMKRYTHANVKAANRRIILWFLSSDPMTSAI